MTAPSTVKTARADLATRTATIASGQSLSAAIDLGTYQLARIAFPAAWTAADLTFQVSADGTTYNNLYTAAGTEYTVEADASRDVILTRQDFEAIRYLKIRSGTSGAAVNQAAERTLTLTLVP
jgi:hypothetical protein